MYAHIHMYIHMYIFWDNLTLHFGFCHNHLSTHPDLFPLQNLLSQKFSIFLFFLSMPLSSGFMSQSLYFITIEAMLLFLCFGFFSLLTLNRFPSGIMLRDNTNSSNQIKIHQVTFPQCTMY